MPKKKNPIAVPLSPLPKPGADQGFLLRALADVLRFVADLLTELARRR